MAGAHGSTTGLGGGIGVSGMGFNVRCPSDLADTFHGGVVSVRPHTFAVLGEGEVVQHDYGVELDTLAGALRVDAETTVLLGEGDLCDC